MLSKIKNIKMANWDKLDEEFYNVVNNLTDREWQLWRDQQHQNRMIRKKQKEMEMEIHLLRLSFLSFEGQEFLTQESVENIKFSNIETIKVVNSVNKIAKLDEYALAA